MVGERIRQHSSQYEKEFSQADDDIYLSLLS